MSEHDAEPVWRRPGWRDLLMAVTWGAAAGIVALPACAGPTLAELTASLDLGLEVVPRAARLAGGLATPVALLALGRRLRRRTSDLSPDERHFVQGTLSLTATLAGYALGGAGSARLLAAAAACLASSVAGASVLLAPRPLLGAWRGLKLFVWLLRASVGVALLAVLLAGPVVLALKALGQTVVPSWLRWWLQLVVPTICALFAVGAAWVSAAEAEEPAPAKAGAEPPTSRGPASR